MLNFLKNLFEKNNGAEPGSKTSAEHKLLIAACALLLEIASADDNYSDDEKSKITEIMKNKFELSDDQVQQIFISSEGAMENSVSLYEFTDILNKQLNTDEKYEILKYLWQIAYADGNLDTYEDHFIKKISSNLHMSHKDKIAAKLEVKKEYGL